MLDFGPCLSFAVLHLALGLVEHVAFIEPGVRAAPRCDLPDDLTTFMLFTLLDTGVSSVCTNRAFVAAQQLDDLRDISHIGSSIINVMNKAGLYISENMGLHPEEILVTFPGLMHLGTALSFLVLGRARGRNMVASTMVPWRSDKPFPCR